MEITRAGARPSAQRPADRSTGTMRIANCMEKASDEQHGR
jgi:hypothetical protein